MPKKFAKEILVYKADELADGSPVYAVAANVDEIPEDTEQVGVYVLNKQYRFRVRRELV